MNQQSTTIPQPLLVTAGVLLAVLGLTLLAYTSHSQQLLLVLVLFPVFVYFVNNVSRTFAFSLILSASALTLPGLPFKLNLDMLFMSLSAFLLIAGAIIGKQAMFTRPQAMWVLSLGIVMMVTALFRGFGLRSMGGASWGGFTYITMWLSCIYYIASGNALLTEKQWRTCLFWLCLLSAVPTAAQALYAFSGGALGAVFYFVVPEFQVLEFMYDRAHGSDLARLHQANITSQYFCILAFLLTYKRRRLLPVLFIALALLLAGISGNRIALVFNLVLAFLFFTVNRKKPLASMLFHPITLIGSLVVLVLSFTAEFLPITFQRVLSIIPFANVSWEAKEAATSTINWRLEVWAAALKQVPHYLVLGKGFAFSAQEVMTMSARSQYMNDLDYVLASRNYHNGMIHTLLDLGLPGLLVCVGFIVSVIARHGRILRRGTWHSPLLQHYHHVVYAVFITSVVVYFVLAGGIVHVALFMLWAVILEGLVRTDNRMRADAAPRPAVPTSVRRPGMRRPSFSTL